MPYLVHLLLYSNSQIQGNDPTYVLNSILPFKLYGFEMKLTLAFYSAVNVFVYILLLISSGRSLFQFKIKIFEMVFHSSTFDQLVILFFVNKREVTLSQWRATTGFLISE